MVVVSHKDVIEGKSLGNMINQFFDLWVCPNLPIGTDIMNINQFRSCLVELFPQGGLPKVLLNQDAHFHFELNSPKLSPEDVGSNLSFDIKDIKDLKWIDSKMDPNSAKVMIVRFNTDLWIVNFDFRYNLSKAKNRLQRVHEFTSSITTQLRKHEYCPNVLVYLLWSLSELIWDVKLHLIAQEVTNGSHKDRIDKLEIWKNLIADQEFFDVYEQLAKSKNMARYGEQNIPRSFNKAKLQSFFSILKREAKTIPITI